MLRQSINAEVKLRELLSGAVVAMRAEIDTKPYTLGQPLRASGNSSALLDYSISEGSAEIIGAGYTFQMKFGREPGKQPPTFIIQQWLIDKGIEIPERLTIKSFAFLIARKIGREGTIVHREGGIALFDTIINQEFVDRIAAVLVEAIGENITLTFTETLKQ
jgi:hypothetical protein